ncbi:MAG: GntR family transcriptional regulator [Candidatus Hydrogenedentes bacterium]|nr:GntR family transcriptional regulator [Candidatus Hydrogenedentota bacterium]
MHFNLSQGEGVPLYLQLVQQIKHFIATGRLTAEDELPPVRVLAQQLLVNPQTVVRAYRELETQGLIYKRRGAGTYVSARGTPYTDEECRRILSDRARSLLVEARSLGFDLETTLDLVRACSAALDRLKEGAQ